MKTDEGKIPFNRRCEIGERLRKYRVNQGITQEKMAELLEISKTHYGQVERGNSNLGEYRLLLLVNKMTDIDLNYIFTGQHRKISLNGLDFDCPQEKLFHVEQIIKHISALLK